MNVIECETTLGIALFQLYFSSNEGLKRLYVSTVIPLSQWCITQIKTEGSRVNSVNIVVHVNIKVLTSLPRCYDDRFLLINSTTAFLTPVSRHLFFPSVPFVLHPSHWPLPKLLHQVSVCKCVYVFYTWNRGHIAGGRTCALQTRDIHSPKMVQRDWSNCKVTTLPPGRIVLVRPLPCQFKSALLPQRLVRIHFRSTVWVWTTRQVINFCKQCPLMNSNTYVCIT